MLGKVFEKLLPENFRKGKGSYYTPRFVVSFMSKQIIKNFLVSKSNLIRHENFIYDLVNFDFLDEDVLTEKIEQYQNKEILKTIDSLLTNIKICDPAIGSGAFPVLIMNEIVKIRFRISNFFEGKKTIYFLKREFIDLIRTYNTLLCKYSRLLNLFNLRDLGMALLYADTKLLFLGPTD